MWEERRVVVDILEVDLDIGVSDQAVAALVLGEHGEAPLGPPVRLVPIQGLNKKRGGVKQGHWWSQ